MDWLFGDIPPAGKSALTGGLGVFAWFLIQLFRAYRDHQKDKQNNSVRETARQGRLDNGFSALDESRDRDIRRLNEELDTMRRRYNDEIESMRRRHADEIVRCERMNDRKREEIERLIADRNLGWDLGRGMEIIAHQYKHDGNNLAHASYVAGKNGLPPPEPLPPVPPLHMAPRTPPK